MRVLVCGGRDYTHRKIIDAFLFGLAHIEVELVVMEGGAMGADLFAGEWAEDFLPDGNHLRFPANWKMHGKGAGPRRNQRMLAEGQPDMVLAFVSKPLAESIGTADMVRRARAAGVPVHVIEALPNPER
jgi:hypothetical protein